MAAITTTRDDDTTANTSAFFCVLDAMEHNKRNRPNYTAEQQDFSADVYNRVTLAYTRSTVYRTYRKNFIAIKVDTPNSADLSSRAVTELDNFAAEHNIVIAKSGKHLIYRIPA
jgi:hypothetical protein